MSAVLPSEEKKMTPKLKASTVVKSVLKRSVHPVHLYRAAGLHWTRKANRRRWDDAQLKLYAEVLPGDFLHFGYFEQPNVAPEDMTLNGVVAAQERYGEMLVEHAVDRESPVLDVGCGMGGLCRMLLARGFQPVALSPDRLQVAHVQQTYPSVTAIRTKFEELPAAEHAHKYGTVFTSESLQYLKLDRTLPLMREILKPGGRWIACDFFHRHADGVGPFHHWDAFRQRVIDDGWQLAYEQDITENVLPTL